MNPVPCTTLYVLAHPDDEIGVVLKLRADIAARRPVHILFVTSGKKDEFHERPGESRSALVRLGLTHSDMTFWHYTSPLLKDPAVLPDIIARITESIDALRPEEVFVPAYEGGSADHDLMPYLVSRAVLACMHVPAVYEFPLYNLRGKRLRVFELIPGPGNIITQPLTDDDVAFWDTIPSYYPSQKRYLRIYRHMMKIDILKKRGFQYRELPNYDYVQKPHRGILLYAIRRRWLRRAFEKMTKEGRKKRINRRLPPARE